MTHIDIKHNKIQSRAKVYLQLFVWKIIQLINNNTRTNSVSHIPNCKPTSYTSSIMYVTLKSPKRRKQCSEISTRAGLNEDGIEVFFPQSFLKFERFENRLIKY